MDGDFGELADARERDQSHVEPKDPDTPAVASTWWRDVTRTYARLKTPAGGDARSVWGWIRRLSWTKRWRDRLRRARSLHQELEDAAHLLGAQQVNSSENTARNAKCKSWPHSARCRADRVLTMHKTLGAERIDCSRVFSTTSDRSCVASSRSHCFAPRLVALLHRSCVASTCPRLGRSST